MGMPEGLCAYEFRSQGRTVVILWTRRTNPSKLDVPGGFQVLDLMGNAMPGRQAIPGETPLYLIGK